MRPIRNGIFPPTPPLLIEDMHLAVAVHDDKSAAPALHRIEIDESDGPVMSRFQGGMLFKLCRSTDMEGPHRQLGPRLADGLGRDDPDGFADVHQVPRARSRP